MWMIYTKNRLPITLDGLPVQHATKDFDLKNQRCPADKIYNARSLINEASYLKEKRVIKPPPSCENVFCFKENVRPHQQKAHQEIVKEGEVS